MSNIIRAERAAKRINNKLAKEYPLLALMPEFLTTPEEQEKRLNIQEENNKIYFAKLDKFREQSSIRGLYCQAWAEKIIDPDIFQNRIKLVEHFPHISKCDVFGNEIADHFGLKRRDVYVWIVNFCNQGG